MMESLAGAPEAGPFNAIHVGAAAAGKEETLAFLFSSVPFPFPFSSNLSYLPPFLSLLFSSIPFPSLLFSSLLFL